MPFWERRLLHVSKAASVRLSIRSPCIRQDGFRSTTTGLYHVHGLSKEYSMAANSYYNTPEQQQHLLAHASPISDQFSQLPTPLRPLHLPLQFAPQTSHQYKPVDYEKHDGLQDALLEDAVRSSLPSAHSPTDTPSTSNPASAASACSQESSVP